MFQNAYVAAIALSNRPSRGALPGRRLFLGGIEPASSYVGFAPQRALVGVADLDLQRRVLDVEPPMQVVRDPTQERVAGMAGRRDEMACGLILRSAAKQRVSKDGAATWFETHR